MTCSSRIFLFGILLVVQYVTGFEDIPCKAKQMYNQSVVCVCTKDYCDTVIRTQPQEGHYFVYTSSKAGDRFKKSKKQLQHNFGGPSSYLTLNLDPSSLYQTVEGFGTSVTDSAAINWKSLTDDNLQDYLVNSYFGYSGIDLNMMRVPIGSTDFSIRGYTYNDFPEDDATLSNFSLAYEDYNYKIPFIQNAFDVSTDDVHIVSSVWTPPLWMKNHHTYTGISRLKKEYFELFALYHLKFLEAYDNEGIPIWALTPTNEPLNGVMSLGKINRLSWSVQDMGDYIADHLGPMIKNSSKFKDVKILAGDDQMFCIPMWFNLMLSLKEECKEYIDGVAFHYYFNYLTPRSMLTDTMKEYPNKFLISTEASEGTQASDDEKVLLGSWERAENYAHDIIGDLNENVTGWIDWNFCLDGKGGPTWQNNRIDSAIIVNSDKQEFYKQPMYYSLGHFSKFLRRGSRRIRVTDNRKDSSIEYTAFLTPQDTYVVILLNKNAPQEVSITVGGQGASVFLDASSITTVELKKRSIQKIRNN